MFKNMPIWCPKSGSWSWFLIMFGGPVWGSESGPEFGPFLTYGNRNGCQKQKLKTGPRIYIFARPQTGATPQPQPGSRPLGHLAPSNTPIKLEEITSESPQNLHACTLARTHARTHASTHARTHAPTRTPTTSPPHPPHTHNHRQHSTFCWDSPITHTFPWPHASLGVQRRAPVNSAECVYSLAFLAKSVPWGANLRQGPRELRHRLFPG
jgi:hypothetical protein